MFDIELIYPGLPNKNNDKPIKPRSSQYLGVYWVKATQKWKASVWYNKKHIQIGFYEYEQDAAAAYNDFILYHVMMERKKLNNITVVNNNKTRYPIGIYPNEEKKRRGRPLGCKDKVKRAPYTTKNNNK